MTFDASNIKFEEPIRHELLSLGRHYYTQKLNCKGNDLLFTSDWFRSSGISRSMDKKPEILVKNFTAINSLLNSIEDVAVQQLKLPQEYQHVGPNEPVFKRQAKLPSMYVKLNPDFACFDKNMQVMNYPQLSYGDYRVIIHVKGIYIGIHGNSGKLASLQVRVAQLQFVPLSPPCYFSMLPMPNLPSEKANNSQVDEVIKEAPLNKKSRRPKLTRQNAMIENRQEQTMEIQSEDFDIHTDMDFLHK